MLYALLYHTIILHVLFNRNHYKLYSTIAITTILASYFALRVVCIDSTMVVVSVYTPVWYRNSSIYANSTILVY